MEHTTSTRDRILYFCTVADARFIVDTITLFESLVRHIDDSRNTLSFTVLCLDERAVELCKKMDSRIHTVSLSELNDTELLATQSARKVSEFAQTSKASFVCYLLGKMPQDEILTFTDSDICYYSDPSVVLQDADTWSVLMTSHWFTQDKKELEEKVGIYNSGFICFKNDAVGKKCAESWRKDCIAWCFNRTGEGRFTDQFYLEKWIREFSPLEVSTNKGLNLGTWNIDRFAITGKKSGTAEEILVGGDPLVCYHFHGLKLYLRGNNIKAYPVTVHHKNIYKIYIRNMQKVYDRIRAFEPTFSFRFSPNPGILRVIKQIVFRWRKNIHYPFSATTK